MDSSTDEIDDGSEGARGSEGPDDSDGAREVEVPLHLYKVVTVFSTMFAVAFVVGGFIVLDTATQRATLSPSEIDLPFALVGVAMIVAGALVYVFATRFQAEGMGKPKDGSDERSDNG